MRRVGSDILGLLKESTSRVSLSADLGLVDRVSGNTTWIHSPHFTSHSSFREFSQAAGGIYLRE